MKCLILFPWFVLNSEYSSIITQKFVIFKAKEMHMFSSRTANMAMFFLG